MKQPDVIILEDAEYRKALGGTTSWYNKLGFIARAFYWPSKKLIVILKGNEGNKKLVLHEYLHFVDYEDSDHPTTFVGTVKHTLRVKFDCRASSGLFRFRYGPVPEGFNEFWEEMHG